ncbi:MAG TPA: VWA domain-containing protein [Isosphaeraceae bacterium]|jgi:VWFA-related protein|nr:VWA domain-containing protein [Isosphaeraceae bacterium]
MMSTRLQTRIAQLEAWIGRLSKPQMVGGLLAFAVLWVCLMSIHLPGAAAGAGVVDDGTIKAEITHLDNRDFAISLSMRVTGPGGKVVGSLDPASFEVTEDGQPVAIKNFVIAGQQPIRATLVIDRSGSMRQENKLEGAKSAAQAFLGLMHDEVDHLGLTYFDDQIREVVAIGPLDAHKRERARDAIDGLEPGGGTELFHALDKALESMTQTTGRRLILALTDGKDNAVQHGSSGDADRRVDALIARAKQLNIPLYMIGLGSESDIDVKHMMRLAEQTGGRYFSAPSAQQLADLYRTIAETLQNEYAFSYDSPTPEMDGMVRTVAVAVRRGGSGTSTTKTYSVGGVLSGGTTRQRVVGSSGSAGPVERASSPFLVVFVPLLVILGLLFGIPYARLIQPASAQPTATPPAAAAAPSVAAASPVPPPAPQPLPSSPAASAPATQPQPSASACPTCGRPAPGSVGNRYCMFCDRTF